MQAQLKRACMWTREHVFVSACVDAKNDWVPSVCVFMPQSSSPLACISTNISECCCLPFWLMSACPSVHLSVSLHACLCAGFYVQPSVLLSTLLYASLDVFFSV